MPEYAGGPNELSDNPQTQTDRLPLPKKEVWFAGTHSDIGGGATKNEKLTSNGPALRWMIRESIEAGLSLKPFSGEWGKVHRQSGNINQTSMFWLPMEILPGKNSLSPHLWRRREILGGQRIHESVYKLSQEYTDTLSKDWPDFKKIYVEQDEFDVIAHKIDLCVGDLKKNPQSEADEGRLMIGLPDASSKDGRLAYQDLFESLKKPWDAEDTIGTTAKMKILCHVAGHFPKCYASDLPSEVRDLLRPETSTLLGGIKLAAKEFVKAFSHAGSFKIHLDAEIKALSISRGGSFAADRGSPYYLAVASAQTVIPIYNLFTRQVVRTLRGHTKKVEAVSFSPNATGLNDLRLVSASTVDGTIRVWNVDDGSQWKSTNAGHKGGILSISFSADGRRIVSGGLDCSANLWGVDPATQTLTHLHLIGRHTNRVFSAAVSPDGFRVVSVSKDKICLWDWRDQTTNPTLIKEIDREHHDPKDVIFLRRDDGYLLSASLEGVLTAWSCEDGTQASRKTLELPQGVSLRSLAFEQGQLACGLSDGRIMVWTVQLGSLSRDGNLELTESHTYDYHLDDLAPSSVTSLVFSDDLKHLFAGYEDGYVVSWYAKGITGVLEDLSGGHEFSPSSGDRVHYSSPQLPEKPIAAYSDVASSDAGSRGHGTPRAVSRPPNLPDVLEDVASMISPSINSFPHSLSVPSRDPVVSNGETSEGRAVTYGNPGFVIVGNVEKIIHAPPTSGGSPAQSLRVYKAAIEDPGAYKPPEQPIKIQDMDDFRSSSPRMPAVLADRIDPEDWDGLVQDLKSVWFGQLQPALVSLALVGPDAELQVRLVVMDILLGSWNRLFFSKKGVNLVLYEGCVHCSGPRKGESDDRILIDEPPPKVPSTDSSEADSASSHDDEETRDEREKQKRRMSKGKQVVGQSDETEAKYALYVTEPVRDVTSGTHSGVTKTKQSSR
ncbi:hypothetical protein PQX77_013442 [Marasmius sp. AFHP31]|nr:hypothetical protein PQX77_013442 [Marasmius sp. AFHP31]